MTTVAQPTAPTTGRGARMLFYVLGAVVGLSLVLGGAKELLDLLARQRYDMRESFVGVRELVIDNDAGRVTLRGVSAGAPMQVRAHVSRGLAAPARHSVRSRGSLRLTARCPQLFDDVCRIDYTVDVPAGVRLSAKSGNGDIKAAGLESNGRIALNAYGGGIEARGLAAKALTLGASAGTIVASGVRAETVGVGSSGGSVDLIVASPARSLNIASSGGSVLLHVPDVAYDARLTSSGGVVLADQLKRDPVSRYKLTAVSSGGSVIVSVKR